MRRTRHRHPRHPARVLARHPAQRHVQGASTIEQQFVKNALQAQSHRTVFEKLREAALAYQLSHKWSKEKILTAYLNTIYFGNGAYGIESAAQTYSAMSSTTSAAGLPGQPLCVARAEPWEAALLAGIIPSPTEYDPATNPRAARPPRSGAQADVPAGRPRPGNLPGKRHSRCPRRNSQAPQVAAGRRVDDGLLHELGRAAAGRTLRRPPRVRRRPAVKTTLDLGLQRAAEQAIDNYLPYPSARPRRWWRSKTRPARCERWSAGETTTKSPFNLATEGERQPGSSFKAFDLAAALEHGISPDSVWASKEKVFVVPDTGGHEKFVVHNDKGAYTGARTLTKATACSDNSVYAEVGLHVGPRRSRAGPSHGDHHADLDQPRDDDRRPDTSA